MWQIHFIARPLLPPAKAAPPPWKLSGILLTWSQQSAVSSQQSAVRSGVRSQEPAGGTEDESTIKGRIHEPLRRKSNDLFIEGAGTPNMIAMPFTRHANVSSAKAKTTKSVRPVATVWSSLGNGGSSAGLTVVVLRIASPASGRTERCTPPSGVPDASFTG